MLHYICDVTVEEPMGIGTSGRIVIEVDPALKRELYAALSREGWSLKDWFIKQAESYTSDSRQLSFELREGASNLPRGNDK